MKKALFSILSFAIFSLVTLPSLLAEDLNDLAYRYRFLLKAGTILNSEGIGDCLLFPYYDVRSQDGSSQITEVTIENGSEYGIAAKLRVREWFQGREVFSTDIWIPSGGVWSGQIELAGDGTNAKITSVHPVIVRHDTSSFYLFRSFASGSLFSILKKKGGGTPLCGYIEVIGEERTAPSEINSVVGRLATIEQDCPNDLKGRAVIHRVEEGVSMDYDAVAIGNFSRNQGSLFRSAGSPYPRLDNGEDSLDQLEFQLSKWEIFGPYSLDPSIQEKTRLIITFPTKHFHYQNFSKRINQINNPFKAPNMKTGEMLRTTVTGENPGQAVDSTINLPFSMNVVGLYDYYSGVPSGIENVGMSIFYESGEVTVTSDHFAQRVMIGDYEYFQERFSTYRGLPALGLLLREYRNPDQLQATLTPVEFSAVWEASDSESVFVPAPPSGPSFGSAGVSYSFTVSGSASSLGHPIQYFIDWGDGTNSGWLAAGTASASKTWTIGGIYTIHAKARCSLHTDIVSGWSDGWIVTIESVSAPTSISGPAEGIPNESYAYTASGSVSSVGHPIEYQFDWGDGTTSEWGSGTQSKAWGQSGTYTVKARARCFTHPVIVSGWSSEITVTIESVSSPTTPVGPSAGSPGVVYTFGTGGAVSNLGHPVEYQFDWGDGTLSPWGPATQTKSWNNYAEFKIRARARCSIHPSVVSDWSGEVSFSIELVTTPSQPIGTLSGMRNKPYTYAAGGAISTNGHDLEYQFDWGDGSTSPWTLAKIDPDTGLSSASQIKVWTSSGTYVVRARARCSLHPTIMSGWSSELRVVIEFVSTPVAPSGPEIGTVGEGYFYSTGGSSIDSGHPVQYRFDWGDTTTSEWLPVGTTGVGNAWVDPGTYAVRAQARCAIHREVISDWSLVFSVTIVPGPPPETETISAPFIDAYGPPDRGTIYEITGNRISGRKHIPYAFRILPGVSNLDHQVEHQFDWGDGTFSEWDAPPNKAWSTSRPDPYLVRVRTRCAQHPTVVSGWSSALGIVIDYITPPTQPDGPATGTVGTAYTYTSGGSTSEIGQEIQYRFHWGDGTNSGWLPLDAGVPSGTGTVTADKTWAIQGTYTVRVEARGWWYLGADLVTQHFSYYSQELIVTIRP